MTARNHPSSFTLERFSLGELSGAEQSEVSSHVDSCARCKARLSEMDAQAASYSGSSHSSPARQRFVRAEQVWRRNAMLVGLVPAAAAIALVVAAPWNEDVPPSVAERGTTPIARHGRSPVELRPAPAPRTLRSVSLRGQQVELGQGTLEAATDDGPARPFVLEHTDVVAEVTGFVSAVTVTQQFKNPFATPVEAIYVFPLPDDSAVDEMTLTAGTRVIKATIRKREQARREYEEAKAQGRRAALLDQERPNLFTQSVANLLPGETVKVTLRYVAPLRFDDGAYTFNFPMVVGPRYIPGAKLAGESQGTGTSPDTTRVLDASRVTPPAERPGRDISVEVRLEAGTVIEELWSVSHQLVADRASSSHMTITLDPADRVPNKDLILRWRVSGEQKRAAVLSSGGAGGTFALMLNPEQQPRGEAVVPREMVFLIDTSCSMAGAPLEAAKRAMRDAMTQMNPSDTFILIDFADRASSFHDAPLPNTPANVSRALSYLAHLPAAGGTNQLDGIRRALGRPTDPSRLRTVLLMTDGFIGNEREIFAETERLLGDARLFGFGIGGSVNHYLLSRLSDSGRGFYQYVRTDEDPTQAVARFVRRLQRPLLTDVSLEWSGVEVHDVLPRKIPDLFDTQPLIVIGRYRTPGVGTVTLKGRVRGEPVSFTARVAFEEKATASGLTTMWARAKVEEIDRLQHFGEFPEAVQAITTLGLEYHLVTAYTSFVAVEQTPVTSGQSTRVVVPTAEPDDANRGGTESTTVAPGLLPQTVEEGERGGGRLMMKRMNTIQIIRGPANPDPGPPPPPVVTPKPEPTPTYKVPPATTPVVPTPPDPTSQNPGTSSSMRAPNNPYSDKGDDFDALYDGEKRHGGGGLRETVKREVFIPPAPGSAGGASKDELGQGDILEVVVSHKAELAACVAKQRERMPGATGKLVVKWTIGLDGRVTRVTLVSEEHRRFPVAACVMDLIKKWKFPAHTTPGEPVTFPFKF